MNIQDRQLTRTIAQFYDKPIAKVSMELFFSVAAVIVFAIFAIRPTLVTMSDLVKEIHDKQALSQKLDQKIAELSTLQNEYQPAQQQLSILDQAIPPTPEFAQALLIIEKLASEQGLVIRSLQVQDVPKETNPNVDVSGESRISRPIVISLLGDYPSVRQFVENLLNTQRTMVVSSIAFNLADERGTQRLVSTITINIEYFGTDTAAVNSSSTSIPGVSGLPQ